MEDMTQTKKDILLMYVELMEQRENFSGHYEGNLYNGINIFANGIHSCETTVEHYLSSQEDKDLMQNGLAISELCKLAEIYSDALDNDCQAVIPEATLTKANAGNYNFNPVIKSAICSAHKEDAEFSSKLLDVFNLIVLEYFQQLTSKASRRVNARLL